MLYTYYNTKQGVNEVIKSLPIIKNSKILSLTKDNLIVYNSSKLYTRRLISDIDIRNNTIRTQSLPLISLPIITQSLPLISLPIITQSLPLISLPLISLPIITQSLHTKRTQSLHTLPLISLQKLNFLPKLII